jgi:hypothetical protein
MELLEYFSHFLPELDIGSPERRALSSTEWNKRGIAYKSLLPRRKLHLAIVLPPSIHICAPTGGSFCVGLEGNLLKLEFFKNHFTYYATSCVNKWVGWGDALLKQAKVMHKDDSDHDRQGGSLLEYQCAISVRVSNRSSSSQCLSVDGIKPCQSMRSRKK